MRNFSRFLFSPYVVAVVLVLVAIPLSTWAWPGPKPLSSVFFAAVMVAAWYGGLKPGLLATLLSTVALDVLFLLGPHSSFLPLSEAIRLLAFVLVAALISSLNAAHAYCKQRLEQRARRKDEFLAMLAHELRNPLSPILQSVELLRVRSQADRDLARASEIVDRQVGRLARLIDDLLDLSRIDQRKMRLNVERVDLAVVIAAAVETTQPLFQARGHRLETAIAHGVSLDADRGRLEQIIVNLLTNAAKYSNPGGRVALIADQENDHAVLSVRDTGIGIAPAVLPHLFDLFAQAQEGSQGGLGIGLYLARTIVELHGGSITASSAGLGCGSEFTVRLPLKRPERFAGPLPASTMRPEPTYL
jgi:signal transduction histidine kinase